jgi:hypothetical protein
MSKNILDKSTMDYLIIVTLSKLECLIFSWNDYTMEYHP